MLFGPKFQSKKMTKFVTFTSKMRKGAHFYSNVYVGVKNFSTVY